MKKRIKYGIYIACVLILLCGVALLSGFEAVRRDRAQAELEKILDFAYGELIYYGHEASGSGSYAIFKDDCYSYRLDLKSNVLKDMQAHRLPEEDPVTRDMLVRLIAHSQQDRSENIPVRLVDPGGALITGDELPGNYYALYRERAFLHTGTCKEAMAVVENGQISHLTSIQTDSDLPLGKDSISREQAMAAAYAQAVAMSEAGELQNPVPGTPYYDSIRSRTKITLGPREELDTTCLLEIHEGIFFWKVTFSGFSVGTGKGTYTFHVNIGNGTVAQKNENFVIPAAVS